MAEFHEVPVIEVNSENILEVWPSLILSIKTSTFIAIDTELSGLGERKQLFAKSIDDRYKAICEVAKSRSVIALGLSCFRLQPKSAEGSSDGVDIGNEKPNVGRNLCVKFVVQTFNIFALCNDSYVVEPQSLRFLVEHGFDFNSQYAKGLPYSAGNDKPSAEDDGSTHLRRLFAEVALARVPIVLHNALVDLVFLYQGFYANLPSTLASFSTDLSQIFSEGIYDTKYIAEFKARLTASFLEYSFRKCQRGNCLQSTNRMPYVDISFLNYSESMLSHVVPMSCGLKDQPCHRDIGKTTLCQNFAGHGWCKAGSKCPDSHDIDMILDAEELVLSKKKGKKRSKKSKKSADDDDPGNLVEMSEPSGAELDDAASSVTSMQLDENSGETNGNSRNSSNGTEPASKKVVPANRSGGHRAGFDAFMTGYIFASCLAKFGQPAGAQNVRDFGVSDELSNRVYLGGKDFPLQIASSSFAKPSKLHLEKWERLNNGTVGSV